MNLQNRTTKNQLEKLGFRYNPVESNTLEKYYVNVNKYGRDENIVLNISCGVPTIAIMTNCGDFMFKGKVRDIQQLKDVLYMVSVYFKGCEKRKTAFKSIKRNIKSDGKN
jgi:hypothetical protein